MDDQGITSEQASALAGIQSAAASAGSVTEAAIELIAEKWGRPQESSKWTLGADHVYFARFAWDHEDPGWLSLELTFRPDNGMPDATGGFVFMAGITHAVGRDPFADGRDDSALADGFTAFRTPDKQDRRMRVLRPEELVAAGSIDQQARQLADWVIESFDAVDKCFQ